MKVVATWMYCVPPGEKVLHHQTGSDSDLAHVQEFYWQCVFCLFASSRRVNADVRHILFVNKDPPARLGRLDTQSLISSFCIEIVKLDQFTRPPLDYHEAWNTQFIIIDILEWLARHVSADDVVVVLDADCIVNRPLGAEFEAEVRKRRALLYSIDYAPEYEINGLTRVQLKALASAYEPSLQVPEFVYSGGECVCAMGNQVPLIAQCARSAYNQSVRRHALGQPKFLEEAHLLSYVYHVLRYDSHTANAFIRRIWTDRSMYCSVQGDEQELAIWHLPAEKRRGFTEMFNSFCEEDGRVVLQRDDYALMFGIRERLTRKVRRMLRSLLSKLRGLSMDFGTARRS